MTAFKNILDGVGVTITFALGWIFTHFNALLATSTAVVVFAYYCIRLIETKTVRSLFELDE